LRPPCQHTTSHEISTDDSTVEDVGCSCKRGWSKGGGGAKQCGTPVTRGQCSLRGTSNVHFVAAERRDYSFVRAVSTALNRTVKKLKNPLTTKRHVVLGNRAARNSVSYPRTQVVRLLPKTSRGASLSDSSAVRFSAVGLAR